MIAKPFSDLNNNDVSQWTVAVARDGAKEIPWVKSPCRRFIYIEIPQAAVNYICLAARVAPFSVDDISLFLPVAPENKNCISHADVICQMPHL